METSQRLDKDLALLIAGSKIQPAYQAKYAAVILLMHQIHCGKISLNLNQLDKDNVISRLQNQSQDDTTFLEKQLLILQDTKNIQLLQQALKKSKDSTTPLCLFHGDDEWIYFQRYFEYEKRVAHYIQYNQNQASKLMQIFDNVVDADKKFCSLIQIYCKHFDNVQIQALRCALMQKFTVITGGPGSGKSSIIEHICNFTKRIAPKLRLAVAAPTGKAAARIRFSAQTLHRLLEISDTDGRTHRNHSYPLALDLLIVDEASMMNLRLMAHLIDALPSDCSLVLVGDQHQLPPINLGEVFPSLCQFLNIIKPAQPRAHTKKESLFIKQPLITLKENYRVEKQNSLNILSHWLQGKNKKLEEKFWEIFDQAHINCFWTKNDKESEKVLQTMLADYYQKINMKSSANSFLSSLQEFIILTPFRYQTLGSVNLNIIAHQEISPYLSKIKLSDYPDFLVKDLVVLEKNIHHYHLYNGQSGLKLMNSSQRLFYYFNKNENNNPKAELIDYGLLPLPTISRGYCLTIHKSQGSEYQQVVLMIPKDIPQMVMNLRLFYTAVTRARSKLNIIGCRDSFTKILQQQTETSTTSLYQQLKILS